MKTQLIWRWDTFIDVLLAMAKIVFAWILWSILFEGKEQIAGMGFYTMISYYIISSYLYQLDKSSEISQQMTSMLRNGTFSKYMVIPVHIQSYFIAMVTGKILFSVCIGFFTTVFCFCFLDISFVSVINIKILFCGVIMIVLGLLF